MNHSESSSDTVLMQEISHTTTTTYHHQEQQGSQQRYSHRRKQKRQVVKLCKLFSYATRCDKILVYLAWICSILVGLLQPASSQKVVDAINDNKSISDATMPAVYSFVEIGAIIMVLAYIANALWVFTGERQTRRIKELYMHSILRQDMGWFDQADEGSLTTRLATDVQLIQDGISERFGAMLRAFASFIIGILMALAMAWRLALVLIATMVPLALVTWFSGRVVSRATQDVQDSSAQASGIAEQVFAGIRTVYSFSLQGRFSRLYDEKLVNARQDGERRALIAGACYGTFLFVLFADFGLAFWYAGKLVSDEMYPGWRVIAALFGVLIGSMSILSVPGHLGAVSTARGAAYRIFKTIDRIPLIDIDSDAGIKPEKIMGDIEFRNVNFAYPTRPDIPILKDLSIKIKAGMSVAFVGPSGSGKSTTIQLIQRFYDTLSGQVLLDGQDVRAYNLKSLREQIGVVSQEPVLFNMTIRQNLLLGSSHSSVSQDEIVAACKKANCHSFITKLPNGYDSLVGEHGSMMSGGQKQRIAIARAILKNPTILLLDEATSALDTRSERLVQRALDAASANRTTITIAHRLSTIKSCDLIVVMQAGAIVEMGSHNQLIQRAGVYSDLVNKQQIATQQVDHASSENQAQLLDEDDEELLEQDDPQDMEKGYYGMAHVSRSSSHKSIDAYEMKRIREKQERKEMKQQSVPIGKIFHQMRNEWLLLLLGCGGAAIAGAIYPATAYIVALTIQLLMNGGDSIAPSPLEGVNLYGLLFAILGVASFIGYGIQHSVFDLSGERYTERLRSMLFKAYIKQEVGYYDQHSVGALTARLAVDSRNVNELVTKVPGDIVHTLATTITGLVISFVYSWRITLIMLAMSPVVVGASFYESRVQRGFSDKTSKAQEQSGEIASEAVKEIRTVTALGKQGYFESKYCKALERPHRLAQRKAWLSSIGYSINQGFVLFAAAVAFYASMKFMEQGIMELDGLFVCLLCVMITMSGIGSSSVFATTYARAKNSAIASFAILERQSEIDPELEGIEPTTVDGTISFRNVGFRYPARPDIPVFDGCFNLGASAGMTVALVGPSGCGKSTTIGMLQRYYDPTDGLVQVDEHNTRKFTLSNLRKHMSIVGQEPVLFDMSIGDNIRFGVDEDKQVTQQQVEDAARAANIHKFISELPEGYNTRVGDKGSQLSGGQKQRIAIARALIRQPRILLLDEATSALDSESEKLVQAAIDDIVNQGGRTILTIAHRLSTIQNCDMICFVKDGRIVEQGTHWELLRLNGHYAALVRQQSLNAF
ncbi:p-glycoprotein [Lichtheimia hyalospora FSU 10163]|nr:p-glycoprotein [Lichtheimia hyalospora FSU 10163]